VAHLDAVPLPGGEAAIREPWRTAAIHLELSGRPVPFERWDLVRESLKVNAPLSSGMGRLFDAVAAVLGVRNEVTYEGQAAVELELLAGEVDAEPYPWAFGRGAELVALVYDDLAAGRARGEIAARFHETVAAAAAAACAEAAEPRTVAAAWTSSAFASSRIGRYRRTTVGSATARPRSLLGRSAEPSSFSAPVPRAFLVAGAGFEPATSGL
jgi:hydrogenase maturation factor HypF (carbamoyltransferase family)